MNEFWDLESLRANHDILQKTVHSLRNDINSLEQQRSVLVVNINMHNQAISTYNGLNWICINEFALENDIPVRKAVNKFLSDVEEQYDKKLGFEHKLENMRDDLNNLRKEQVKLRTEILLNPLIGPKLLKLTQSGLSEQDIINVADIIKKYGAVGGDDSNIDMQSLVSDLNKYGGLKSELSLR
jgi:hypothetical protein